MKALIKVQPIGGYFEQDNEGFIVNPTNWNLIDTDSQSLIQKYVNTLLNNCENKFHSIYIRGSIPRGAELKTASDVDLFALVHKKGTRWEEPNWSKPIIHEIAKNHPIEKNIEFNISSYHPNLAIHYPELAAIISTQSLCIYGEDLIKTLPKYGPQKALQLNYRWLESDLELVANNPHNPSILKDALKSLIRTGFEIVMERENRYTPDLYWCVQSFSHYYPEHSLQMETALNYFLNTDHFLPQIAPFLTDFGPQIVKESLKSI